MRAAAKSTLRIQTLLLCGRFWCIQFTTLEICTLAVFQSWGHQAVSSARSPERCGRIERERTGH